MMYPCHDERVAVSIREDTMRDIAAIVEKAVIENTLPMSMTATARSVAGAIISESDGDAASYQAVKSVLVDAYRKHGTVEVSPADFAREVSVAVNDALLSVTAPKVAAPEPPVKVETPTVENLTAALASLGRTAADAPEALSDELRAVLARFDISSE